MLRWTLIAAITVFVLIGAGGVEGIVLLGAAGIVFFGGMRLADSAHRAAEDRSPMAGHAAESIGWIAIAAAIGILFYALWRIWVPMYFGG